MLDEKHMVFKGFEDTDFCPACEQNKGRKMHWLRRMLQASCEMHVLEREKRQIILQHYLNAIELQEITKDRKRAHYKRYMRIQVQMTYPIITEEYKLPLDGYKKAELEFSYVPFMPFTRKSRWQLGYGVRGRYYPASGQIDLLDDSYEETHEILMHEAGHARNPAASEPDIRQNTRNKLKNPVWH